VSDGEMQSVVGSAMSESDISSDCCNVGAKPERLNGIMSTLEFEQKGNVKQEDTGLTIKIYCKLSFMFVNFKCTV
jgi:hypothetical protein